VHQSPVASIVDRARRPDLLEASRGAKIERLREKTERDVRERATVVMGPAAPQGFAP
jgi:hypothetical protein